MADEETDLLAEISDDPTEDSDYGRGWRDAMQAARDRIRAAVDGLAAPLDMPSGVRHGMRKAAGIVDDMMREAFDA